MGGYQAPQLCDAMLSGLNFLITGFGEDLDVKRRSVALIREHGGSLLPDLPPMPEVISFLPTLTWICPFPISRDTV